MTILKWMITYLYVIGAQEIRIKMKPFKHENKRSIKAKEKQKEYNFWFGREMKQLNRDRKGVFSNHYNKHIEEDMTHNDLYSYYNSFTGEYYN